MQELDNLASVVSELWTKAEKQYNPLSVVLGTMQRWNCVKLLSYRFQRRQRGVWEPSCKFNLFCQLLTTVRNIVSEDRESVVRALNT